MSQRLRAKTGCQLYLIIQSHGVTDLEPGQGEREKGEKEEKRSMPHLN